MWGALGASSSSFRPHCLALYFSAVVAHGFPADLYDRWRWSKGKKQPGGKKVKDEAGEDVEMLEELKPKDKEFLALVSRPF